MSDPVSYLKEMDKKHERILRRLNATCAVLYSWVRDHYPHLLSDVAERMKKLGIYDLIEK